MIKVNFEMAQSEDRSILNRLLRKRVTFNMLKTENEFEDSESK